MSNGGLLSSLLSNLANTIGVGAGGPAVDSNSAFSSGASGLASAIGGANGIHPDLGLSTPLQDFVFPGSTALVTGDVNSQAAAVGATDSATTSLAQSASLASTPIGAAVGATDSATASLAQTASPASSLAGAGGATGGLTASLAQPGTLASIPVGAPGGATDGLTASLLQSPQSASLSSTLVGPGGGATTSSAQSVRSAAPASTLVGAAGGLQFNLVWDSSVSSAPAEFKSAAIAAATFFTHMFSDPATITINVGWGELNGWPIGSGSLSESTRSGIYQSYASVRSALLRDPNSSSFQAAAESTLPATDPLGAKFYYVSTAEAKALGLMANTGVDGSIGLSSAVSYDFNVPSTPMAPNQYDAIGAFEHEISEVMGRFGAVGSIYGNRVYTPLDLFRYTSPGVRDTTIGPPSPYFSIDSGATNFGTYSNPAAGGDASDWVKSVAGDAFGAAYKGQPMTVSPTDLVEQTMLGYSLTSAGLAVATTAPGLA
jgi:hypothetical protein